MMYLVPLVPVYNVYHYYSNIWYEQEQNDAQTVQMLLEIAANNDVQGLQDCIQHTDPACFNAVGVWNGFEMTPLMVAAAHGSLDIVEELISSCKAELDCSCGHERVTALHCAASSGSVNALDVVILLLDAGADPDIPNAYGLLPRHVTVPSPQYPQMRIRLRNMLTMDNTSPVSNARDELFLQVYKVYECAVEGPHGKKKCAFFHPGEGDRRRNPRQYRYAKHECKSQGGDCRGELCLFSHIENEYKFHPERFKSKLCRYGATCRNIGAACYRAHSQRERRLRNKAALLKLPVIRLDEVQQQMFLDAERFTKYFFRRVPVMYEDQPRQLRSYQEATSSNS